MQQIKKNPLCIYVSTFVLVRLQNVGIHVYRLVFQKQYTVCAYFMSTRCEAHACQSLHRQLID